MKFLQNYEWQIVVGVKEKQNLSEKSDNSFDYVHFIFVPSIFHKNTHSKHDL